MTTDRPPGTLGTQRIEALTDGVFAIAMTLLVLELRLPEVESDASLAEALIHLAPRIAGYVLSFLVLGAYWLGLHTQYTVLRGADRVLIWITIVFLMLISAVPFTTSLLSEHSSRPIAPAIYGLHLTATGLVMYLHWWWASGRGRLVDPELPPDRIAATSRRILIGPLAFLIGIPVAFVAPQVVVLLYLLVLAFYIVSGASSRFS